MRANPPSQRAKAAHAGGHVKNYNIKNDYWQRGYLPLIVVFRNASDPRRGITGG